MLHHALQLRQHLLLGADHRLQVRDGLQVLRDGHLLVPHFALRRCGEGWKGMCGERAVDEGRARTRAKGVGLKRATEGLDGAWKGGGGHPQGDDVNR